VARYTSIRAGLTDINNPLAGLEVQLEGEWVKLEKVMGYFSNQGIKRDIAKAQRDFLERYKKHLIKGLMTAGSHTGQPFAPHSSRYHSPTGQIGIRSTKYLQALQAARVRAKNYSLSLYLPQGILRQKSANGPMTVGQYIWTFEHGRRANNGKGAQPPRPLFRPAFENRMGGHAGVTRAIRGAIGLRLKKLGINIR
jgi:hypothetical protein